MLPLPLELWPPMGSTRLPAWARPLPGSAARRSSWASTWPPGNKLPQKCMAGACLTEFPPSFRLPFAGPGSPSHHCFLLLPHSLARPGMSQGSTHQPAPWLMRGAGLGEARAANPKPRALWRAGNRKAETFCTDHPGNTASLGSNRKIQGCDRRVSLLQHFTHGS